jgi:hypothetical protein
MLIEAGIVFDHQSSIGCEELGMAWRTAPSLLTTVRSNKHGRFVMEKQRRVDEL